MTDYNQNLRRRFADEIYKAMKKNKNIVVVTGDLGYRIWDQIKSDFPKRFYNIGAAEQSLIGIAVGLALGGKIPIAFSITPFLLYRPFETIRNYVDYEKIPVKLIGSGRNKDYNHDGFSHWSEEDKEVMKILKNINSIWPETADEVSKIVEKMIDDNKPWYINLKR
jgi:transketolase